MIPKGFIETEESPAVVMTTLPHCVIVSTQLHGLSHSNVVSGYCL